MSIKGEVEQLLNELGIEFLWGLQTADLELQDCLPLLIQNRQVGKIGKISQKILESFDIEQDVYFFTIEWDKLSNELNNIKTTFKDIPRFPSVHRDLSLVLIGDISYEEIATIIQQTNSKLIINISLFDKFQPINQSICYGVSIEFYDSQKTLTDARIDQLMQQILNRLEETGEVTLRK